MQLFNVIMTTLKRYVSPATHFISEALFHVSKDVIYRAAQVSGSLTSHA